MAMNWNSNAQLPRGWEARWDQNYQRYYFIDHATHQTTWNDPRLAFAARNTSPAEQIPLQEFHHSQPSTSAQTSSTSHKKETSFKHSIETASDESEEDDEWRDALLRSTMMESGTKKHLLFHEKINMKEKFKREFKELDAAIVENTVEKNDYDEDISRAILESLKDSREEEERKKREEQERRRREKEEEEKRKAAARKMEMEKWKREMKAKKEAAAKAEREAKMKDQREAKVKAERQAKLMAERQAKLMAERQAKLMAERQAKLKAEREAKIKAELEEERKRSAAAARKKAPTTAKPMTPQPPPRSKPPDEKPVYVSANRLQTVGPQASLRKGPDRRNLVHRDTSATGPNHSLVSGPQTSNRQGPSTPEAKVSLSKGAQASLRQGPQCRLMHGQERSTLAEHSSRVVSPV